MSIPWEYVILAWSSKSNSVENLKFQQLNGQPLRYYYKLWYATYFFGIREWWIEAPHIFCYIWAGSSWTQIYEILAWFLLNSYFMSTWKGRINSEFVFSPRQKFRAPIRWNMKFGKVDVVIWTYKAQGSKLSFWKDVKNHRCKF